MRKQIMVGSLVAVLAVGSLVSYNAYQAGLPIRNKIESCFKRYTHGVSFDKKYAVSLKKVQGDNSREAITDDQLVCAGNRLGFTAEHMRSMHAEKDGRIDLSSFSMEWGRTLDTECLILAPKKDYKSGTGLFDPNAYAPSVAAGTCLKEKVTRNTLWVSFKDYR
jgi:hypothetical protein